MSPDDESLMPQSSRLRYTLRDMQHLTHVELGCESLWCHPEGNVDAINDNLPPCIETLDIREYLFHTGDPSATNDSSFDEDPTAFDATCIGGFGKVCWCRMRDIRRLLLDERLCRLRRVTFNPKYAMDSMNKNRDKRDPQALRHVLTAAVQRRGWKMPEGVVEREGISGWGIHSYHEAVLYRELPDE